MPKVKGYYNTINGIFLGPMTAVNEATGVASTPRYVEGVCFGEYDTDTDEFIPHTNPMIIPKGTIVEQDDRFDAQGRIVTEVRGYEEDKGADLVRKGSVKGFKLQPSNVYTADEKGNPISGNFKIEAPEPKANGTIKEAKHPTKLKVDNLPDINWDELFS